MEQAVNLPDDLVESIISKAEDKNATEDDTLSQTGSEKSKDSVDPILKWIEKKELFIALERSEDAQQTEQALAVLPMKVCNREKRRFSILQSMTISDLSSQSRTWLVKDLL